MKLSAANTPKHLLEHAIAVLDVGTDRPEILLEIEHASVGVGAVGVGVTDTAATSLSPLFELLLALGSR